MEKEDLHILRLMGEIERNGNHSQRELSRRLNISLGLVNTFLKRLVNKGYFKVKTMPRKRVKYFITAEGLARKTRLTVEYLQYSVHFYKEIKTLLLDKFRELEDGNVKSILFLGNGEVAELAYLYLQLTNLKLVAIVDDKHKDKHFFEFRIAGLDRLRTMDWDVVLLTRLEKTDQDINNLMEMGVHLERIATI